MRKSEDDMSAPTAPTGTESRIRAIVYREGDVYVAQCIEYDIATQASDIETLLDRLELTIEAEFEACEEAGKAPKECICPAPVYYHELWGARTYKIDRVNVSSPLYPIDVALAKAA